MNVLVVAMCDSVHTARWLGQFVGTENTFTLYPSTPHRRLHPKIREELACPEGCLIRIRSVDRLLALPLGIVDTLLQNRVRAFILKRLISRGNFDMVHILESQHAGYIYAKAVKTMQLRPPVALSIWGNDLYWFGNSPKHKKNLRTLLSSVDLMFAECIRDQHLARDFGYHGVFAARIPASGGVGRAVHLTEISHLPRTSTRRGVVVKGYTGFRGRASLALQAIVEKRHLLNDCDVSFYSASWRVLILVRYFKLRYKLPLTAYRKKSLSHAAILELFQKARISLAVSMSDGFPGSAREAMWTGAFPIESVGSCVGEWLSDGTSCLLVDPNKPETVSEALERALTDDVLVDTGSQANYSLANQLTIESVREIALDEYMRLHSRTRETSEES